MENYMKYFVSRGLLVLIALDVLALGFLGWLVFSVATPVNTEAATQEITIEQGASVRQIADLLKEKGIIESPVLFTLFVAIEGEAKNLRAGTYKLSGADSIRDILDIITGTGGKHTVRVTIPEGYTKSQIAATLEKENVVENASNFLQLVNLSTQSAVAELGYSFLAETEAKTLEGFLFPDTYEFRVDSEPEAVLDKFFANFERKTKDLRATQVGDFYDVVAMASLIEKEVQTEQDMKLVAGVLYNRLEVGMPLQVDATLAFITGKKTGELTNADKEIDSPYNTYQNRGLPPAPITNPGLRAMEAAVNPTPNNYFYYLSDSEGNTHFAETLEQHNENKARYLQ